MPKSPTSRISIRRGIAVGSGAGVVAALAYAAEHEWDLRAFRYNADDLIMLRRLVTDDPEKMRLTGLGVHIANGAAAGIAYALLAHHRLPGPPVVRGITFAIAEVVVLYPIALIEDVHPAIREGRIARYLHPTPMAQNILRHIAFGAVLGPLTAKLLDRTAKSQN